MPLNFDDYRPRSKPGVTYVIASTPYDGWAKIGRTGGALPHSRLAPLQTGNPRKLVVRVVWAADYEAFLHRHYLELRGQGEWFAFPTEMVDFMAAVSRQRNPAWQLVREWPPERVWEIVGGEQSAAWAALELSDPVAHIA